MRAKGKKRIQERNFDPTLPPKKHLNTKLRPFTLASFSQSKRVESVAGIFSYKDAIQYPSSKSSLRKEGKKKEERKLKQIRPKFVFSPLSLALFPFGCGHIKNENNHIC